MMDVASVRQSAQHIRAIVARLGPLDVTVDRDTNQLHETKGFSKSIPANGLGLMVRAINIPVIGTPGKRAERTECIAR